MPVSIQRFNQHGRRHPNDRIIFIKALPGPDYDTANDFLHRIAAICVPIMTANSLSVMTLEEHEPNREFVGRNFNAGEVVQLVLKAPSTGRFLPFRYVQMVMMHELAHCKQMNHSRAFWAVRNAYAGELRQLWSRNYTGEGLWGRGRPLYADQYDEQAMPDPSNMFENLCGGTYRSRGRKRKHGAAKPQLSYAEKKKRRIEKKFGVNGQELGGDEELRVAFEKGKSGPKPRVAGSNRGRELRLQAMLFRAEQQKAEDAARIEEQEQTTSDDDADETSDPEFEFDGDSEDAVKAVDRDGNAILDEKGRPMVRIREQGDDSSKSDAQSEWSELGHIPSGPLNHQPPMPPVLDDAGDEAPTEARPSWDTILADRVNEREKYAQQSEDVPSSTTSATSTKGRTSKQKSAKVKNLSRASETSQQTSTEPEVYTPRDTAPSEFSRSTPSAVPPSKPQRRSVSSPTETDDTSHPADNVSARTTEAESTANVSSPAVQETRSSQDCAACSFANTSDALVCVACGNVLDIVRLPRYWRCQSNACAGSVYINTADAGRCGVCAAARPQ